MPQNYDYGMGGGLEQEGMLSIFNNTGRSYGRAKSTYFLDDQEYHTAHTYILLNCEEVKPDIQVGSCIYLNVCLLWSIALHLGGE